MTTESPATESGFFMGAIRQSATAVKGLATQRQPIQSLAMCGAFSFPEAFMFGSLLGLVGDVAKLALAPVAVAVELTAAAVKPVADAADAVAKDVKDAVSSK